MATPGISGEKPSIHEEEIVLMLDEMEKGFRVDATRLKALKNLYD